MGPRKLKKKKKKKEVQEGNEIIMVSDEPW